MNAFVEIISVALLITDLVLVISGRLLHSIRWVAIQGILLGLLPLLLHESGFGVQMLILAVINLSVKGILLPLLLIRAMRKADVRRELEPFVGYTASLILLLAATAICFGFCRYWNIAPGAASPASVPVAFTTMVTGLFIIIARRKAITQAIGFLIFENGISMFGICMMLEHGLMVELGILLDVFVLVFVMGIALFNINREFAHTDSDKLNSLGDWDLPAQNHKDGEAEQ